jgi:hypothetical protein
LLAIFLSIIVDFLVLVIGVKVHLPISILAGLIFFGGVGLIIGYRFTTKLPWQLIVLVGIIRFLAVIIIHGNGIYEALISISIFTVFIDIGICFRTPPNI